LYEDKCVSGGCHYFEREIKSQNELDEYIANHAKTGCQGTIECDGLNGIWQVSYENGKVEVQRSPDAEESEK